VQTKNFFLLRLFAASLKQSLKGRNNEKYHKPKYVSWQQKFLVNGVPHHFCLCHYMVTEIRSVKPTEPKLLLNPPQNGHIPLTMPHISYWKQNETAKHSRGGGVRRSPLMLWTILMYQICHIWYDLNSATVILGHQQLCNVRMTVATQKKKVTLNWVFYWKLLFHHHCLIFSHSV